MSKISEINANFKLLGSKAQSAVNELIEMILAKEGDSQPIMRRSKRGLESKATLREDDEIERPSKKVKKNKNEKAEASEGRGRGRPRKEEVAEPVKSGRGRPRKVEAEPAKPAKPAKAAKVEKTAKAEKVAAPVKAPATDIYAALNLTSKGKGNREAELQGLIKKVEKYAASDKSWQDCLANATKKGVTVIFGRGKPSGSSNKRKIAIAMINAGKL